MSGVEFDLGEGFKISQLLKKGYFGYFEGRSYRILNGETLVKTFSETQGEILSLIVEKRAMTPKQISDVVGITPAGVLYNLKPLLQAGIIERHELPGGSVFYASCWDVAVGLSPALKAKIEPDVDRVGGWAALAKVPMRELRSELSKLSEDEFMQVMRYLVRGAAVADRV